MATSSTTPVSVAPGALMPPPVVSDFRVPSAPAAVVSSSTCSPPGPLMRPPPPPPPPRPRITEIKTERTVHTPHEEPSSSIPDLGKITSESITILS